MTAARLAAAIAVLAIATVAQAGVFDPARTRPLGFDHLVHDRKVVTSGAEAIACERCHKVTAAGRLTGRPGHAACFGACHGPPPKRPLGAITDELARVCVACHAPSTLAAARPRGLSPPFPPYTIDRDWGLAMSHRAHDAAAPCQRCHTATRAAPHVRCTGCHAGATAARPTIDTCAGCHVAAYGPVTGPHLDTGTFAVGSDFSHPRHAARGATCRSCHAAVTTGDDVALPAPTMASCGAAGCHDGGAAFATTEACTRCHRRAPTGTFRAARPDRPFSHVAHAPRLEGAACGSCHGLDRRGEAAPPGHRACARCHADDFARIQPTTCGACHASTEPWRPLHADRLPAAETELGARFSHRVHRGDCARCHQLASGRRELRPPRGHASCTGDGCHARSGAPAPALAACDACHELGLIAARERSRDAAPWSVRPTFRHRPHRVDVGGTPLPCDRCHVGVADAADVASIPTPPKATCAPCHDGRAAFKLTGHGCARCHQAATAARPPGGT